MVHWDSYEDGGAEFLYDPEELIVRFYIAVEQTFYISADVLIDYYPLEFQTARDVEVAHPDIFKLPGSDKQYRPISELHVVRSRIFHEPVSVESAKSPTSLASMTALKEDVTYPPKLDRERKWTKRPGHLFMVDVHLDTLHLLDQNLRSGFVSYNYVRSPMQVTPKMLESAFREALNHLQVLTRNTYKLARNAVDPLNAKILDPQIPYALYRNEDPAVLQAGFVDNHQRQAMLERSILPQSMNDLNKLEIANIAGPFDDHTLMVQEADAAFSRGLNRSAMVMIASAVETLLNTLLQLLDWESNILPEDSAEQWDELDSIVTRVKSTFPGILGGSWTFDDRAKSLRDWEENIVRVRNDVVHGSRIPSDKEVERAFHTMNTLVSNLVDRLTNERNRNKFIRTAFLLAGHEGLEKRDALTKKLRRLQNDPSEPNWNESALTWMAHHLSWLQKKKGLWDESVATEVVLVIRSRDRWAAAFQYAPDMMWAREITNLQDLMKQLPSNKIPHLTGEVDLTSALDYVTVNLMDISLTGLEFTDKVPSFHILPFSQITPGYQEPPRLTFVNTDHFSFTH